MKKTKAEKLYYLKLFLLSASGVFCAILQSSVNIPALAFVSFSPLMYCLCRFDGRRDFARCFFCFFFPYYFYQLVFLFTAINSVPLPFIVSAMLMFVVVVLLALWECLLMLCSVYSFMWLRKGKIYDVIILALLIAGGEWLQEKMVFLAFPWSAVWLCVTDEPLLMQSANLLGCRLVSVIILSVNGFAAQLVVQKKITAKALSLGGLCTLFLGIVLYGNYSVSKIESTSENGEKLNVVCAQDDAMGEEKNHRCAYDSLCSYEEILKGLSLAHTKKPDIIILPETAISTTYDCCAKEFAILSHISHLTDSVIITGCFYEEDDKSYNAVYGINPDGTVSEPYFKQVLVPFGEKIPLAFLWGTNTLSECDDPQRTLPITTEKAIIGTSICIESIFPSIVSSQARNGAQLLCVSTNDSWFGSSYARQLHFRHSIMRAVENGRYLLRAGNCGISAIISPSGKIQSEKADTSKGIVSGEISLTEEQTLFTRTGDLFPVFPALLIVTGIIRRYSIKNAAEKTKT